ncbi:hepatoma-derived growth factor-related protein 2 [Nothobranchius furzeri]|uniref:hepatoma-derived growth factor-related protein 2 n=1 Tax=Nothobranchius furzeri TaxID=105023 RepID=UPI003904D874
MPFIVPRFEQPNVAVRKSILKTFYVRQERLGFIFHRLCHFNLKVMPPLKSRGRPNAAKHSTAAERKATRDQHVRQPSPTALQTATQTPNRTGKSPACEQRKSREVRTTRRNKAAQGVEKSSAAEKASGEKSQDNGRTRGLEKNIKATRNVFSTAPERIHKKLPIQPGHKTESDVSAQEEEEEEEEERGGNKQPAETQRSEESSEESEASGTQSDAEQSVTKESGEEEVSPEPVASTEEGGGGGDREKEAEVSDRVSDENEITPKESGPSTADEAGGQQTNPLDVSDPVRETKYKMFRRSKADKKTGVGEKQKAEKQRRTKEAKQKAKEEKKSKKEQPDDELGSSTEEVQPSIDNREEGMNLLLKKTKRKTDSLKEDDSGEEKEEVEQIVLKPIKGQRPMFPTKEPNVTLGTGKQQHVGHVIKGKQKSLLLGRDDAAPLQLKAENPDEETPECPSSRSMAPLMARRTSITAFRRVSGWIQKKIPQPSNLKKPLSALTRAIGISHWLSKRATKLKKGTRRTNNKMFKHKMAMRVASETSLFSKKSKMSSEDPAGKEKANLQEQKEERVEETVQGTEKELEAKFAVVLPRMNKLSKAKMAETFQRAPASSAPSNPPEEPYDSKPKPPKPGAKLVLPVRPDLGLLKSIRKPGSEGLLADANLEKKSTMSLDTSEESSIPDSKTKRATTATQDGVNALLAARRKLKPSRINLSRMPVGTNRNGLKGPDVRREEAAGASRSTPQCFPTGQSSAAASLAWSLYEEETDREVAQLMGEDGLYTVTQPDTHWTGNPRMSGDPQVGATQMELHFSNPTQPRCEFCLVQDWLRSESLLPHQTVEKLTKWTVYNDEGQANDGSGPWESEDPAQEMLERWLASTQVSTPPSLRLSNPH